MGACNLLLFLGKDLEHSYFLLLLYEFVQPPVCLAHPLICSVFSSCTSSMKCLMGNGDHYGEWLHSSNRRKTPSDFMVTGQPFSYAARHMAHTLFAPFLTPENKDSFNISEALQMISYGKGQANGQRIICLLGQWRLSCCSRSSGSPRLCFSAQHLGAVERTMLQGRHVSSTCS